MNWLVYVSVKRTKKEVDDAARPPEKKMQFKTHPWNDEKCKHVLKGRLRNRENAECIGMMYRDVSDKNK